MIVLENRSFRLGMESLVANNVKAVVMGQRSVDPWMKGMDAFTPQPMDGPPSCGSIPSWSGPTITSGSFWGSLDFPTVSSMTRASRPWAAWKIPCRTPPWKGPMAALRPPTSWRTAHWRGMAGPVASRARSDESPKNRDGNDEKP